MQITKLWGMRREIFCYVVIYKCAIMMGKGMVGILIFGYLGSFKSFI